jgi:hypothetical protein
MNDSEQDILTFYSTESTSPTSSTVQPVILDSTGTTRRILRPTIVKNTNNDEACLRIELIYERTGKNGFESVEPSSLSKLKAGEALSCSLSSKETLTLYTELSKLYALGKEVGIKYRENSYAIIKTTTDSVLSKNDEKSLVDLLQQCQTSPGLAEKLATTNPELIENAYHYRLLQKKHEGLARFKVMLQEECKEQEWQDFFAEHDWILGGICEIQILSKVIAQPTLAGANVFGKNEKIGDFLLGSQGNVRFTAVAEIKKSKTDLLKGTPYRGTYYPSDELNGGLAQLRSYMRKWQLEGSRTDTNKDFLESKGIYTIQPRGILIIGHLDQLKESREKRDSFELFRQNQKDVHIVTFDEVYYRALHLLGKVDEVTL